MLVFLSHIVRMQHVRSAITHFPWRTCSSSYRRVGELADVYCRCWYGAFSVSALSIRYHWVFFCCMGTCFHYVVWALASSTWHGHWLQYVARVLAFSMLQGLRFQYSHRRSFFSTCTRMGIGFQYMGIGSHDVASALASSTALAWTAWGHHVGAWRFGPGAASSSLDAHWLPVRCRSRASSTSHGHRLPVRCLGIGFQYVV